MSGFFLALLLALAFGPPTNLSVSLRAVGMTAFKVQFSWRAPDSASGYRYVWKAIQGQAARLDTTTAKSATIKLARPRVASSYTLCVATLSTTGYQSADACRTLATPRVDSLTVVELRQAGYGSSAFASTVLTPNPERDSVQLQLCGFVWIRGKVVRDPVVDWNATIPLIYATSDRYRLDCLPRVPSSLLWPLP